MFALQVCVGSATLVSGRLSVWWNWFLPLGAMCLGGFGEMMLLFDANVPVTRLMAIFGLGSGASAGSLGLIWPSIRKKDLKALQDLREQHAQRRLLQNGIAVVGQNVEMREAIRASKRRNLRSQMNPHFLFNVLTGVQHLLIRDQREKALHIFERFRHLLVQSFQIQHKVVGSIAEELQHVQEYIELELRRVTGPFEWSISCAENVNTHETPCPLLVLQPLVENAIWHGLRGGRMTGGNIRIEVNWEGHDLVLKVLDNGRPVEVERDVEAVPDLGTWSDGTPKQEFTRDSKYGSRALAILKERLALFRHKGSFTLTETPPGHPFESGMCAKIHLPFWRIQDLQEWREKEMKELDWLNGLKPEVKEHYEALNREAQAAAREVESMLKRQNAKRRRTAS